MNNHLKDKLFNYKESPPAEAWNRISASLYAENHFLGKLYNYSATPPQHIWSDIQYNLDEHPKQVKPATPIRKSSKIIKYSAAAAIFFAIIFGVTELLSRRSAPTPVSSLSQPLADKPTTGNTQKSSAPEIVYEPKKELVQKRIHETKHTFKSLFLHEKKLDELTPLEDKHLPVQTPTITPVFAAINNHPDLSLADRFMVYTDDDGNHMKLPKKLFSLIHCNSDDYSCKQNLQNLQQKISSASVSADFGGFLDMLKQLQENH